jgi:GntR family transcriptional regulator
VKRTVWEESPYPVTVLEPDHRRAAELGIAAHSWLGAVVAQSGGLLVDVSGTRTGWERCSPVRSTNADRSWPGRLVAVQNRAPLRRWLMTGNAQPGRVGYRDIANDLRQQIDSGELPPGSKVPGENDLTSRYGVAQPTARHALDVLKNEGLIIAKRGSGTFVREFKPIRRVSPDRLKATSWGSGRPVWSTDVGTRPRTEAVTVNVELAPAPVAEVLELDDGARVVIRRRRYVVDDKPVQLATSYYPEVLVAGSAIMNVDTGKGGAYARLTELGHEPTRFREELRIRMPRETERKDLDLAQGTPIALIVRAAYTAEGRPVEVNEMVLDSSAYVIEYKFASHD